MLYRIGVILRKLFFPWEPENKWRGLDGPDFSFIDLGRPAAFLIPEEKLGITIDGKTVQEVIEASLIERIGAFTRSEVPSFGAWVNGHNIVIHDKCRLYEVSYRGKEKITLLASKLAEVARLADEEYIYFKAGQYAALI